MRNTTWTLQRDTSIGLNFAGINYYDGQGFMVRKSLNVKSARELSGASGLRADRTTTELNVADFFPCQQPEVRARRLLHADETVKAYDAGRSDVFTTDASGLYAERVKLAKPDDHMCCRRSSPRAARAGGSAMATTSGSTSFKWTHFAMLTAEELNISKANLDQMMQSTNPEIRRVLGIEGNFGEALGLDQGLGRPHRPPCRQLRRGLRSQRRPLHPPRYPARLNALWTKGGLQYAPPIR